MHPKHIIVEEELDGGGISEDPGDARLDAKDKRILDIIQTGFPLEKRPYAVLAQQTGMEEEEVLERVRSLRQRKVIRRIGANFSSHNLGFHSTLCAAKVPEETLEAFTAEVNRHAGVTHNYLRDNAYNIWFTCIGESKDAVAALLQGITEKTGITILNLPAERLYKIKVDFRME